MNAEIPKKRPEIPVNTPEQLTHITQKSTPQQNQRRSQKPLSVLSSEL